MMNDFMRQMSKRVSILAIALILSGLTMTACGQNNQNSDRANSNQTQEINIPSGVKNSTYDGDVNRETPLVIKVAADNKTYIRKWLDSKWEGEKKINYFDYTLLPDANLSAEIARAWQSKAPDYRVAYIQAGTSVKFGKLTEVFEKIAKSDADKIRLIVNPSKEIEKSEQTDNGGYVLPLILPSKAVFVNENQKSAGVGRGNGNGSGDAEPPAPPAVSLPPGYKKSAEQKAAEEKAKQMELEKVEARKRIKVEKLSVEFAGAGKIKFHNQVQTSEAFSVDLKKVFDERTAYDIFIDGSNEVDKTVYLKISPNVDYGEAVKMIDEIYGLGAIRIYLDDSPNN